jgi:hypothetical protein
MSLDSAWDELGKSLGMSLGMSLDSAWEELGKSLGCRPPRMCLEGIGCGIDRVAAV